MDPSRKQQLSKIPIKKRTANETRPSETMTDILMRHESKTRVEYSQSEMDIILKSKLEEFVNSDSEFSGEEIDESAVNEKREMIRQNLRDVSEKWTNKNSKFIGVEYSNIKKRQFDPKHGHPYVVPPVSEFLEKISKLPPKDVYKTRIRGGVFSHDQLEYLQTMSLDRHNSVIRIMNDLIGENKTHSIKEFEDKIYLRANYATTLCYFVDKADLMSVWIGFCIDSDHKAAYLSYCVKIEDPNAKMTDFCGVTVPGSFDAKKIKILKKNSGKISNFFIYFCPCNQNLK